MSEELLPARRQPLPLPETPARLTPAPRRRSPRWVRTLSVAGGAGAALLATGWLAGLALTGGGVPRGTTVLGVDIGGLSREEALTKLDAELRSRARAPISVRVGEDEYALSPAQAGLELDAPATVDSAGAGARGLVALLQGLASDRALEPVLRVDEARLHRSVAELAARADLPLVEGGVRFAGTTALPVQPAAGRSLDRAGAVGTLRESYLLAGAPVQLPAMVHRPRVSAGEVDRALREFAQPAVSAPVDLLAEGERVAVPPAVLARTLRLEPQPDGRLAPALDADALQTALGEQVEELEKEPRDAVVRVAGGRPRVVPGQTGRSVDGARLGGAVLDVLPRAAQRVVAVPVVEREPDLTTGEAHALGIVEELSSYTRRVPAQGGADVRAVVRALDGTLVAPGEAYSLDAALRESPAGQPGQVLGAVDRGGVVTPAAAGVSRLSSALGDAAFSAGLEPVSGPDAGAGQVRGASHERPPGEAAPVAAASGVAFRNTGRYGVLITARAAGDRVTVTTWGTRQYDAQVRRGPRSAPRAPGTVHDSGPGCVPRAGSPGYDVAVTRVLRRRADGTEVRREVSTTTVLPVPRVSCAPSPGGATRGGRPGSPGAREAPGTPARPAPGATPTLPPYLSAGRPSGRPLPAPVPPVPPATPTPGPSVPSVAEPDPPASQAPQGPSSPPASSP